MADAKENPRAVPADQRSVGPNETMIVAASDLKQRVASSEQRRQAPVIKGIPRLVGQSDPIKGQTFQLKPDKTTVGRSQANDIVINDGTISARHAQIVQDAGTWRVINLISTNGTSVNGQTNIVSYLAPGDTIAFGRVEARFEADSGKGARAVDAQGHLEAGSGSSRKVLLWAGIAAAVVAAIAAVLLLA
jgi:pSer/pThr/pTyr-binding forkhead associated (FHA) protein